MFILLRAITWKDSRCGDVAHKRHTVGAEGMFVFVSLTINKSDWLGCSHTLVAMSSYLNPSPWDVNILFSTDESDVMATENPTVESSSMEILPIMTRRSFKS